MVDVAGGGHIGIALEAVHGTYTAPAKFVAVTSESIQEVRTDPWRVPILGRAVTSGKVEGKASVAGSITMELLPDVFAYFVIASRMGDTLVKSAGPAPFLYTVNDSAAVHVKANFTSLSIVADRAGVGFAYVGCQAASFRFFQDAGIPMVEIGILGREQTEDYTPGAVTDPITVPFNADEVSATIAAAARLDLASIEISLDDNGEARFNVDGLDRASYIKYGEHVSEASFDIDFESKADYAIWKARTTQELIYTADNVVASESVVVELHGAIYDTYEVNLGGIGDQVQAAATLRGVYTTADTAAVEIVVETVEDVAIV